MCRCGQCKNRWYKGGVVGQVSLGNKVRSSSVAQASEFLTIGVASAGTVFVASVGDYELKCCSDVNCRLVT
jgi:hypothetical protein